MNAHTTKTSLPFTDHATTRMNQRGVREEHIRLAIAHGEETYRKGAIHYFVGERLVRERKRRDGLDLRACKNVHVVVSIDTGVVLTAYVNSAPRRVRAECPYNRHAKGRGRRGVAPAVRLAYALLDTHDAGFESAELSAEAETEAAPSHARICTHKRGSYRGFSLNG